ncbi:glycoside hydrolase family 99-like domain-containing protein [Acetobacter sacchari]|uniref:glycoside hydrolase family 99-like domain-containing protein n=1 Tax=Acetobacter sacchari TaxID=2661687 RepID=UPI00311C9B75
MDFREAQIRSDSGQDLADRSDISPLRLIGHSGLFDAQYYLSSHADLAGVGAGALAHYHQYGWREGRKPNPCFDPQDYLARYPDIECEPLLHYVTVGEAEGRRPVVWFDPAWYGRTYPVPEGMLLLRHYLLNRHRNDISPMPEFDRGFYLKAYPDVADAGLDPLEHYMMQGFREARRPFPEFDPAFYRARYLANDPDANPLLHYLEHRGEEGVHPSMPKEEPSIPREVRRLTRPGPLFETRRPLPNSAARRARVLAYYLPQFHHVARNDEWWGEGFTEWTNVARGLPRFVGHYQPRVPRDLGHYTLDHPDVLRRQAEMARGAGVEGFVFYFYWFNGERLLESPLEMLLANPDIDLPFCLMWANENWSRRWDGSDDDILIAQDFRVEDEADLIACFVRHFNDPRYIHIGGRPLLMLYRPGVVPDCVATIARWRRLFVEACGADPIFVMSQSFGDSDPRKFGMDGAIEFPPHKVVGGLSTINSEIRFLDTDFTGQIYDYEQVVDNALSMPRSDFPLIRTAAPSWDNDARRQGAGLVLHGSTPALFERWLSGLIEQARQTPFHGEALICVNAWNEWAEGAYLEPDQHFGSAFLNATGRAVTGTFGAASGVRILLVGHDAFPSGAQMLLLAIGQSLKKNHGVQVQFLLLGAGAMLPQYRELGEVELVAADHPDLAERLSAIRAKGYDNAIVNTCAASVMGKALAAAGICFIQLVHEMPALLNNRRLIGVLSEAASLARQTVFPAESVARQVTAVLQQVPKATGILPQGLYNSVAFRRLARETVRTRLGIGPEDRLIVAAGYADLRKGFDLFLQLWRNTEGARRDQTRTHLIWLGAIDAQCRDWMAAEIDCARESGRFHLPGHVSDVQDYLSAADVFALTSREDPLPSVVMEALVCGLRCVALRLKIQAVRRNL